MHEGGRAAAVARAGEQVRAEAAEVVHGILARERTELAHAQLARAVGQVEESARRAWPGRRCARGNESHVLEEGAQVLHPEPLGCDAAAAGEGQRAVTQASGAGPQSGFADHMNRDRSRGLARTAGQGDRKRGGRATDDVSPGPGIFARGGLEVGHQAEGAALRGRRAQDFGQARVPGAQDFLLLPRARGPEHPGRALPGELGRQGALLVAPVERLPARRALRGQDGGRHALAHERREEQLAGVEGLVLDVGVVLVVRLLHAQAETRRALQGIPQEGPEHGKRNVDRR